MVGFIGPNDIPTGPDTPLTNRSFSNRHEPLFAWETVEYVGQPLGLILAKTLGAAKRGAERVLVEYGPVLGVQCEADQGLVAAPNGSLAVGAAAAADAAKGSATPKTAAAAAGGEATKAAAGIADGQPLCKWEKTVVQITAEGGAAADLKRSVEGVERVEVSPSGHGGGCDCPGALTSVDAAVAAGSWWDLSPVAAFFPMKRSKGGGGEGGWGRFAEGGWIGSCKCG